MIKYTKYILFFYIICHAYNTRAQTLHFSQFTQMEVFYNPATAGFFDGDYRFHAMNRNQYRSVPVPYTTFSAGGDFKPLKLKNLQSGAGLMFNNDQAGDSKFYTRQILLSAALGRKTGSDSSWFIGAGIQPGLTFMGIDESGLTFDNQYQGDSYNPGIDPGENFTRLKVFLPELNAGLFVHKILSPRNSLQTGLSFQHLTRPKRSLFGNPAQWQSARMNIILRGTFRIHDRGDLLPEMLIQTQKKYREWMTGLRYRHWLQPIDGKPTAIYAGIHYRHRDAAIVSIQMDYRSFNGGISYDFTLSDLRKANNRRGGLELSLVYIFKKPKTFIPVKKFCPVYL
jgi:type IX secretion system PorP/SprF family membrane protein